jgi:hypothetical protein
MRRQVPSKRHRSPAKRARSAHALRVALDRLAGRPINPGEILPLTVDAAVRLTFEPSGGADEVLPEWPLRQSVLSRSKAGTRHRDRRVRALRRAAEDRGEHRGPRGDRAHPGASGSGNGQGATAAEAACGARTAGSSILQVHRSVAAEKPALSRHASTSGATGPEGQGRLLAPESSRVTPMHRQQSQGPPGGSDQCMRAAIRCESNSRAAADSAAASVSQAAR